jgi:hypothetical protein
MIHNLSTWTLLITATEAVDGRFLGSVSTGMAVGDAAGPLGAVDPTLSHVMNRLRSGTRGLPWNDACGG